LSVHIYFLVFILFPSLLGCFFILSSLFLVDELFVMLLLVIIILLIDFLIKIFIAILIIFTLFDEFFVFGVSQSSEIIIFGFIVGDNLEQRVLDLLLDRFSFVLGKPKSRSK
jgi:hypothetical protein